MGISCSPTRNTAQSHDHTGIGVIIVCLTIGIGTLGFSIQKLHAQMTAEVKPGVGPLLGYVGTWLAATLLCLLVVIAVMLLCFGTVYAKIIASYPQTPLTRGMATSIFFLLGVVQTASIVAYGESLFEIIVGALYRMSL